MTLYAVWDKPQRDTHVVTVKNSTGDSLTVSVTVAGEARESRALAAGAYQNLTDIPDGAQLVLTASQTAMAFSDQFADEDSAGENGAGGGDSGGNGGGEAGNNGGAGGNGAGNNTGT